MDATNSPVIQWILWLLGFDLSQIPSDASDVEIRWDYMPTSWGVFVLVGIVVTLGILVVFLYQREIATCPRPVKLALAAIRFVVLFMLVVILLKPVLVVKKSQQTYPFFALARDGSQSMNTKDAYREDTAASRVATALGETAETVRERQPSRVDIVNHLMLHNKGELLRHLQRRGKVRVMDFSDQVQKHSTLQVQPENLKQPAAKDGEELAAGPSVPPLDAQGRGTNLWMPIKESLSLNPLAAIYIFTDGQHTAGEKPLEIAELAGSKGVPIHIVGVGDPQRSRSLKIHEVYVREKVWPDEPFEIQTVLNIEGEDFEKPEIRVELLQHKVGDDGQAGPGTMVDRQTVQVPREGGLARATFAQSVPEPGRYAYSIRAEQLEIEADPPYIEKSSGIVEAVDRKAKVLLIAGAPTWEYRMVQRLLRRDRTISVSCWLQTLDDERPQEGDEPIEELPTTLTQLAEYSVIMLFDPNPDEFDDEWMDLLKQFASKQAGGVLYMAGPKFSGQFLAGNQTGIIKEILPVQFGDVQRTELQTSLATNRESWKLRLLMENIDHPIMSFYEDPQKNLARWEDLPGIFWSFPAAGAKPTAKVLLEHSNPIMRKVEGSRPLLVAGRYGPANTVYIGFNGTWRWRRAGRQAEFFDKYWLQVTRFLIETRTLQSLRRGYVEPEREKYEIGDKIAIFASLKDATYEPLMLSQVDATLRGPDGQNSSLVFRQVESQPGQFEATSVARREGRHHVSIELAGSEGGGANKVETSFDVVMPSIEMNQVWLNEQLLREVANRSGGNYYHVNEVGRLLKDIRAEPETIEVPGKPVILWGEHQIPYRLFGFFVLLLCVEWAVRKWYKLL